MSAFRGQGVVARDDRQREYEHCAGFGEQGLCFLFPLFQIDADVDEKWYRQVLYRDRE